MNFTIETLPKSGTWTAVNGDFVFPLSWGEKRDKALDECQVICYNSIVKRYKPSTPIKVTATDGTTTLTFYYIIAKDTSTEYPNGSTKYKHTLDLIEATKYIEGVMCQTLCWTNSLGKAFTPINVQFTDWTENGQSTGQLVPITLASIQTPIARLHTATSIKAIGDAMALWVKDNWGYHTCNFYTGAVLVGTENVYPNFVADIDGHTQSPVTDVAATPEQQADNYIQMRYTVNMQMKQLESQVAYEYRSWSFSTFQTVVESKSTKKWTIADVCNRMFALAEPIFLRTGETANPRFYLKATDQTELAKIIAPEFTISQSTLREQLQLVGGHIHAEPRVSNITNTGGRHNYEITFDYNAINKTQTAPSAYLKKTRTFDIANYATRIHTNVRNVVSTVGTGATVTDPAKDTFKGLRAEQNNLRITETNAIVKTFEPIYDIVSVKCGLLNGVGNHWEIEPQTITSFCFEATEYDSVLSSYSGAYPTSKSYALRWERGQKNITELFYQAPNSYSQALSSYSIVNILSAVTGNATSTIEGYLTNHPEWQFAFQVTYKPVTNTAFIHSKNEYTGDEPFTLAYNQSDSLVEQSYYGENIKGASARIGNDEMQVTAVFTSLADLPKCGYRTYYDGEEYYITTINNQMDSQRVISTIGLTKNFNRISEYIGVNAQKRISEIATNQAYDRDIVLQKTLVLGAQGTGIQRGVKVTNILTFMAPYTHEFVLNGEIDIESSSFSISASFYGKKVTQVGEVEIVEDELYDGFIVRTSTPKGLWYKKGATETKVYGANGWINTAYKNIIFIGSLTNKGNAFKNWMRDNAVYAFKPITQALISRDGTINKVALPAIASGYGNVTVLTTSMKDNYSAGESEHFVSGTNITGYWQQDERFGDYFGRAQTLDVSFFDRVTTEAMFPYTYPKTNAPTTVNDYCAEFDGVYVLKKDSRERLSTISFAIEIQTTIDGLTIGGGWSKFNRYVDDGTAHQKVNNLKVLPHLYIVPTNSELPYKLDTDIIDYNMDGWTDCGEVTMTSNNVRTANFTTKTATADGQGYVVAYPVYQETITVIDENGDTVQQTVNKGGEIFLIYNKPVTSGQTLLATVQGQVTTPYILWEY